MSEDNSNPQDQQEGSNPQPNLAIEYSPMVNTQRAPRQPSNLQDLLRYAVEVGSRGQDGAQGDVVALNENNRGFLMNALNSMMVNVTEELATIIKTLKENTGQKESCIEALDNLSDYVCTIDYANDFVRMGGLTALQLLLEGNDDELQWRAAETIADIVQNNPFSQNFIIQTDFLSLLLALIKHSTNTTVQVKCLYAVSCLVRENKECLAEFIKKDGFSVLLHCIQSKQEKLMIKSCFLISCLSSNNNEVRSILHSMGIVEQMCMLIDIDDAFDTEINEHLLSALSSLIHESPNAQALCQQEPLNLMLKLNYIKEKHAGDEVYHKEIEYANLILKQVFDTDTVEVDEEYQDR
uniref:Hsp70-binding protein 1 n=1 Tax=Cacopsylla melanoneura TaxID=428564 RepID=A0A8D9BKD5_9HEMI